MARIYQSGGSWVITLPKDLFKAFDYDIGDKIEFKVSNGKIIIQKVKE